MWKRIIKWVLGVASADYWNGWVYTYEPSRAPRPIVNIRCDDIEDLGEITRSPYPELRLQAWDREPDAWAFGAWVGSELAAVCWFQARDTYRLRGGFFALSGDEAELSQITTAANFRGQGIAKALIEHSAWRMGGNGFRKLYAKVWHDNISSRRAFERAGWTVKTRFLSLRLRGRKQPVIIRISRRCLV